MSVAVDYRERLRAWDAQQAAYIADREGRFRVMTDILALHCGDEPVVLDLGCGPGSTSARVLERFPRARVIAVDYDPMLLHVASQALAAEADRLTLLDLDLLDDTWSDRVRAEAGGPVDAVVSTTALHWLHPDRLLGVYTAVCGLVRDDGVFLNGDHFRFTDRTPRIRGWSARHDEDTQQAAFESGAEPWDLWWRTASEDPTLHERWVERERRFADRGPNPQTTADYQIATLAQAGFTESGTVWQLLDDYVVYGVR